MLSLNSPGSVSKQWFMDQWFATADHGVYDTKQQGVCDQDSIQNTHIDHVCNFESSKCIQEPFGLGRLATCSDLNGARDLPYDHAPPFYPPQHLSLQPEQADEPQSTAAESLPILNPCYINDYGNSKFEKAKRKKTRPNRYDTDKYHDEPLYPSRNDRYREQQRRTKLYKKVVDNFMPSGIRSNRLAMKPNLEQPPFTRSSLAFVNRRLSQSDEPFLEVIVKQNQILDATPNGMHAAQDSLNKSSHNKQEQSWKPRKDMPNDMVQGRARCTPESPNTARISPMVRSMPGVVGNMTENAERRCSLEHHTDRRIPEDLTTSHPQSVADFKFDASCVPETSDHLERNTHLLRVLSAAENQLATKKTYFPEGHNSRVQSIQYGSLASVASVDQQILQDLSTGDDWRFMEARFGTLGYDQEAHRLYCASRHSKLESSALIRNDGLDNFWRRNYLA